jgi:hypothetical protein
MKRTLGPVGHYLTHTNETEQKLDYIRNRTKILFSSIILIFFEYNAMKMRRIC